MIYRTKITHNERQMFNQIRRSLQKLGYSSYRQYLDSTHWKSIRKELKSFPFFNVCYTCGSFDKINLHHLTYKSKILKSTSINELSQNIFPLCESCHLKVHKRMNETGGGLRGSTKYFYINNNDTLYFYLVYSAYFAYISE